jgi:hypothetical protein
MLGLATFHNVISQSKHHFMTTSMFFVTNPTPPGSGGNPTRGRKSTSKRSVICTNTGNDKSGVHTCTSTVEIFAGVSWGGGWSSLGTQSSDLTRSVLR